VTVLIKEEEEEEEEEAWFMESLLRGNRYCLDCIAVLEGIVKYRYQRSG